MEWLKNNKLATFVNFAVGFFFLSVLIIKGGYNYAPILLILTGLGYFIHSVIIRREKWSPTQDEKWLIISCLFYFSLFVLSVIIHDGRLRELDNPSRVLLLLPLLLLFHHYPIRCKSIFYTIPLGALIAGLIALYDRFYLLSPLAYTPRIMHIQGGGLAMSLAMFSLVITIYFAIKTRFKLTALCLLCVIFGMLGSFLSTARGSWVGIIPIILFILWAYRQFISTRFFVSLVTLISLVVITAIAIPNTRIAERFHAAKDEINAYVKHDNGSTSVGARFDMWKSALLMAQEKPLFGWGSEQIIEERKKQHQKGLISQYAIQFNHAHNQFLDDLSKRGLFGLIALLGIYFIPLIFFIKNIANDVLKIRTVAVLGAVHCLSVMGYSLSQGFLTHNSGNIFYFFLVVVFYGLLNHLKTNPAHTA